MLACDLFSRVCPDVDWLCLQYLLLSSYHMCAKMWTGGEHLSTVFACEQFSHVYQDVDWM